MDSSINLSGSVLETMKRTLFTFETIKPSEVILFGSWLGWKEGLPMTRKLDDMEKKFTYEVLVQLNPGIHGFKFLVDGIWSLSNTEQIFLQQNDSLINCLFVPSFQQKDNFSELSVESFNLKEKKIFLNDLNDQTTQRNEIKVSEIQRTVTNQSNSSKNNKPIKILETREKDQKDQSFHFYNKNVIVMVGLPARGKSFVSRKLCQYLRWMNFNTKVFNIGMYRRERIGAFHTSNFFNPTNSEGVQLRNHLCELALRDIGDFLLTEGQIAILDGTNHSSSRRTFIKNYLNTFNKENKTHIRIFFIEILCDQIEIINRNIAVKIKYSPDYQDLDATIAERDFRERLEYYEKGYETLDDMNDSYLKLCNVGDKTITNKTNGFFFSKIVFYISNLKISSQFVYLCYYNNEHQTKTLELSENEIKTVQSLTNVLLLKERTSSNKLPIWCATTSMSPKMIECLPHTTCLRWKALEENPSTVSPNSFQEIQFQLESVIIELENQKMDVLIVSGQKVFQCLYSYFMNSNELYQSLEEVKSSQLVSIQETSSGYHQILRIEL